MTTNEISNLARANIDKTVKITYSNGETELALVQSVDDEGFVYDLASIPAEKRKTPYWTAFSEVERIECMGPEESTSPPQGL